MSDGDVALESLQHELIASFGEATWWALAAKRAFRGVVQWQDGVNEQGALQFFKTRKK